MQHLQFDKKEHEFEMDLAGLRNECFRRTFTSVSQYYEIAEKKYPLVHAELKNNPKWQEKKSLYIKTEKDKFMAIQKDNKLISILDKSAYRECMEDTNFFIIFKPISDKR